MTARNRVILNPIAINKKIKVVFRLDVKIHIGFVNSFQLDSLLGGYFGIDETSKAENQQT